MCHSPFADPPPEYHRSVYKEHAFRLVILEAGKVHDQVAECGEVLLWVGLSAEVQGGAGLCSVGQSIPTHIIFPLTKPQYCQIKVLPVASFNFYYFPQNFQILQLDYVYILSIPHESIST